MENRWIHTPQGNWLYVAGTYRGVVVDLHGTWSARIEDHEVVHPADVTFLTHADAKTWVEHTLAELQGDAADQE